MPDLASLSFTSLDSDWHWLTGAPLQVVIVIIGALAARWVIHRGVNHAMSLMKSRPVKQPGQRSSFGLDDERRRQRAETMGSLLKSVSTVVIVSIAALTIAAQVGIQLGPIMASAGVVGVALGFGAQSLVKDFLSGIFMIFEDQYGVGDVIDTGEAVGTVQEVSLRITQIRDATGVIWYVRNGEIVRVANRSQGWSTALVDIPVAYSSKIGVVTETLQHVADELMNDPVWSDKLIAKPDVAGVESVQNGAMTFRVIAKTVPNENFAVSREIRRRSLIALKDAGIKGAPLVTPSVSTQSSPSSQSTPPHSGQH